MTADNQGAGLRSRALTLTDVDGDIGLLILGSRSRQHRATGEGRSIATSDQASCRFCRSLRAYPFDQWRCAHPSGAQHEPHKILPYLSRGSWPCLLRAGACEPFPKAWQPSSRGLAFYPHCTSPCRTQQIWGSVVCSVSDSTPKASSAGDTCQETEAVTGLQPIRNNL